jgi:hypothetical protein
MEKIVLRKKVITGAALPKVDSYADVGAKLNIYTPPKKPKTPVEPPPPVILPEGATRAKEVKFEDLVSKFAIINAKHHGRFTVLYDTLELAREAVKRLQTVDDGKDFYIVQVVELQPK